MPGSYNRIWLHVVFSTKKRTPLIHPKVEQKIYDHMGAQLIAQGCPVAAINGMPDHIHLLFLQNPQISITGTIKQVKENTSFWINQQQLIPDKFMWQTGYAAYSVSDSHLERVVNYIKHQKNHHSEITFDKEFEELLESHRLEKSNGA